MKFIEKHPYLLITAAIILACIVFQVPFGWSLLILLGYGLIVYIVNLGTAVGWTGYLLDGFLRRPKFVHKLYRFAIQHNTRCVYAMLAMAWISSKKVITLRHLIFSKRYWPGTR